MPLYKRKPFPLNNPPGDLKPDELVYRVRFTGEIFRSFESYLERISLYRKRHWTCKVTGKGNLTYEEAAISEQRANEQIQQFPEEYIEPVLSMIQFSQLRLEELVDNIYRRFKDQYVEGEEVGGLRDEDPNVYRCKIIEALPEEDGVKQYRVGWMGSKEGEDETDGEVTEVTVETPRALVRKKHPLKKELLKVFIRESAEPGPSIRSRKSPWIVDPKLAKKYNIPTEPPDDLDGLLSKRIDGEVLIGKRVHKKRKMDDEEIDYTQLRRRKSMAMDFDTDDDEYYKKKAKTERKKEPKIVYPIEDALVKPGPDDPEFTQRPTPCHDYPLPLECAGDVLMVWDFCSTFSRVLRLSFFPLEDLERALECRDVGVVLLAEVHTALLRTALADQTLASEFYGKKRLRGGEVTVQTWVDDVCQFADVVNLEPVVPHINSLKRGHYGTMETPFKVDLLKELVACCLNTDLIREQLEENVQALEATLAEKREEELEAKRRKKEGGQRKVGETNGEEAGAAAGEEENGGSRDGDGEDDVLPTKGWQRKGKRKVSAVSLARSSSDVALPSDDGRSEDGGEEAAGMTRRTQTRQQMLKAAAKEREAKEGERKQQLKEEARIAAEKRRAQQEAYLERKQKEMEELAHQRKLEALDREAFEKYTVRTNPLGRDRDFNRYWFFHRDGRIFVEDKDCAHWGFFTSNDELDQLYGSLNPKGIRERALQGQLEKYYTRISAALAKKAKEATHKLAVEAADVRRSTRVKSTPKQAPFMLYVNKLSTD